MSLYDPEAGSDEVWGSRESRDRNRTARPPPRPAPPSDWFVSNVESAPGTYDENEMQPPSPLAKPLQEEAAQMYKIVLRGDWDTAERWFVEDGERTKAAINSSSERPLHVAVGSGTANVFVGKLLHLMRGDDDEALAQTDCWLETALHHAARVGNKEAVVMLVNRRRDLMYMKNSSDRLPVQIAAIHCQKETLTYLIEKSEEDGLNVKNSPFVGNLGVRLLMAVIASEYLDVALHLVDKYPDLARLRDDRNSNSGSALKTLAGMSSAFPNGESRNFCHNFIYSLRPVPHPESIGRKKLMHQQALQLVKSLCQKIESLPHDEASAMYQESIIIAAKNGIYQVVREIVEISPTSVFATEPGTGRNIFSIAAAERHENVFNLLYDMSDRKFNFYGGVDKQGNNFMHLCAKIAPSHKLDLVRGPALQMQRELQWFKEVEKFVHPSRREWPNNDKHTPRMLFSEEHRDLKTKGEEWMRSTANSCSVAVALVATIMFAAAFTVPGGINSESGVPIFRNKIPFMIFVVSDAVSLFTSLTSLLMFLSILTSRYAEEDFLYVLPRRSSIGLLTLFGSITFMMAAFGAALYLMLVEKDAWLLIPVAALACLPIASFVLLQFPVLLAVVSSTYGPSIFGKKTGKKLY